MKELTQRLTSLKEKISKTRRYFDLDQSKTGLKALEYEASEPEFWGDQDRAREVNRRITELAEEISTWENIESQVNELIDLAGEVEKDGSSDLKSEIESQTKKLEKKFSQLEFFLLLGGKYDQRDTIVAIHSGTGGVEAQDWAAMLLRMYLRFCERRGWIVRILDKSIGEEAGIKSVTFEVLGRYAYGYLKAEAGVHRLVRLSPFDADHQRHTSFALVEVLPVLEEVEEVEIDPKDLRIDTFLSSGHGGQSVNTTYSAIRIVHLPTKIMVTCQNERSQTQNKATALKILKSKLHALAEKEQQVEKQKLRGEYASAEWGNQIRSYVLQPYQMVKDHRTKHESSDTQGVLDGKIDGFIEAYLKQTVNRAK
ncbi:MAG: peptide chain release factor 2 [Patescibacteria group bacterium]|nr:peptide chain release factor 2 [Patescibacteria group bacterium]